MFLSAFLALGIEIASEVPLPLLLVGYCRMWMLSNLKVGPGPLLMSDI